jgi:VWFA-related protein
MLHQPLRHRSILRFALCLAPLLASLPVLAAPPQADQTDGDAPPFLDEIRVDVVNVDVVVTDKEGNSVSGLTAEDFVLFEDGDRRTISNFYSFDHGRLVGTEDDPKEAADGAWPDNSTRRRMVLLFDTNSLEKRDRNRAIDAIEQFILEQFDGTYEFAVVAYSREVQLLEPFTADKSRVLSSLAQVRKLPVPLRRPHIWDRTFSEDNPVVARNAAFGQRSGFDQASQPRGVTSREFELRDRMMAGLQTFGYTTQALVQTMRAYSALPGRKSLLLVTGAMDIMPGAAQLFGRGLPGVGSENRTDPMAAQIHSEVLRRFELIVKMANSAGFAIYPMSAASLDESHSSELDVDRKLSLSFSGAATAVPSEIDVETAPRVMAAGTGGEFFSTTRFYGAIREIDHQTANAYVLGFQTSREPDGDYHKIRVEAKRPGLRVRHREGYIHLSREAKLLEELSTPLVFPKDRGDIELNMEVLPPETVSPKNVTLTVACTVPLDEVTLIPQGDDMVGRINLYLAVYDKEGKLVNVYRNQQDIQIPSRKVAAARADVPARFGLTVRDLKRGEYTFTLTLMDDISDRYGTGLQAVEL